MARLPFRRSGDPDAVENLRSKVRLPDMLAVGVLGLRARPTRTILTAVGIALGIAAVVSIVGISASSEADAQAQVDEFGTNFLIVTPGLGITAAAELSATANEMIERIGPVTSAASVTVVSGARPRRNEFIPEAETRGVRVLAADVDLLEPLEADLVVGRWFDTTTAELPAVVLGSKAAERFAIDSLEGTPLIDLSGRSFAVIGILESVPLDPDLDTAVFIGQPIATSEFETEDSPAKIYVRTVPERLDAVREVIPSTASPNAPSEVAVTRPSDALEFEQLITESFRNLLIGVGGVALLVAGVGIANVMVISVLERRGEIGVRRALGATKRHIRVQFVLESMLLALLGGMLGIAVGVAIVGGYAAYQGWQLDVPAEWILAGVGASLLVGATAGLYPAARAARMDPAEAVRPAG
jgi:putative ABC transport system permease protein